MEIIRHGRNVHEINLIGKTIQIAMLSDLHWDNPHCDRDMLKRHLDYCLENNIPVMLNGDTFCLMQGRGDRRANKSDIRPEHNNAKYIDSVIETAVDWFEPYASIITVIGYGNHETGIIKWQETDVIQRFVDLLNYKTGAGIQSGGYGGWLIIKQSASEGATATITTRIKYFHGSGGGGLVTKGAINMTRALESYENMDVFTMGHIHENSARNDVRETLDSHSKKGYGVKHKNIHLMLTGTYKEEYGEGSHGWHIERGAPPKPLGGRILEVHYVRDCTGGNETITKIVDSRKFPI